MLHAGDFHAVSIGAVPASSNGTSFRFIERLQRSPSEQTTTLGPQLGTGTKITTLAATPYLRLRAQIPAGTYTDGANAEFAQNANTVSVFATAAYLGAVPTTWTLDVPDFSSAGYDAAWALKSGTGVSWERRCRERERPPVHRWAAGGQRADHGSRSTGFVIGVRGVVPEPNFPATTPLTGRRLSLGSIEVGRIGLGTNRLRNTDEDVAFIRAAVDAGVQMIDTAHLYTGGESEKAIGHALSSAPLERDRRDQGRLRRRRPRQARDSPTGNRTESREPRESAASHSTISIASTPRRRSRRVWARSGSTSTAARSSGSASRKSTFHSSNARGKWCRSRRCRTSTTSPSGSTTTSSTTARAEGIVFVPYYPLRADPGRALREIANRHQATPRQVMLAWLLKRSPAMLPIPGTLSLAHLQENLGAAVARAVGHGVRRPRARLTNRYAATSWRGRFFRSPPVELHIDRPLLRVAGFVIGGGRRGPPALRVSMGKLGIDASRVVEFPIRSMPEPRRPSGRNCRCR